MADAEPRDSTDQGCRRLEGCRRIVAETLRRQRLSDAEVSRELRIDRSYFGKVRRGERPLTEPLLDQLIINLRLDRRRIAMAVDVMDRPELYFDPTFRNVCYYAQTVLADMTAMARQTGDIDCGVLLAALTRERCELLARSAVQRLATQFAALDPVKSLERAA